MPFRSQLTCFLMAGLCAGCGTARSVKAPASLSVAGKQLGHAHGGQSPITGATIQLWRVSIVADGGLGTAMLSGTVTTSDGSSNGSNSNASAGNDYNTLPAGYFDITNAYTCPAGDALVYITASGGNPGLSPGTNNLQANMVTALGSCNNLKSNVQFLNISEQTTVGTVAALYPFMSAYNAIGASPAHASDLAAAFPVVNEYVDFQMGTAPGPALPTGYSASTGDVNLLANVLAACVNTAGGTYNDGSACGTLFRNASPTSVSNLSTAPTDVTVAALDIRKNFAQTSGSIAGLPAPQAPFQPASTAGPSNWTLPIFQLPSAPTFSLAPGSYAGTQQLRILDADPTAQIYYAFGAATPSTQSLQYTGALLVSGSETINATAVGGQGRISSGVASATYTITGLPANAPSALVYVLYPVQTGSTIPLSIRAQSNAEGSVVTFSTSGPLGGSFSPSTCTISSGLCTVMYTPTGTSAAGTYYNGLTANFSAAGSYTAASVSATVFVEPAVTLTPLASPASGTRTSLIQAFDGYFYGATVGGGSAFLGSLYRTDTSGNITTLYSFTGSTDGSAPVDHLVQGSDGFLYGVAQSGGPSGNGTIFRMDAAGNFTLLYSFTGGIDGAHPIRALIQATDGSFYGTASAGGAYGSGTAFKIDSSGNFTLLHGFNEASEGGSPHGSLLQGTDGMFYGTAAGGGTYAEGTIFKMDASGDVTTLYNFTGGTDGLYPNAALTEATDGMFYGSTPYGGFKQDGALFRIDSSGSFSALHTFTATDGYTPQTPLVQATDGALYGVAPLYGAYSAGTIYKVDTAGNFTLVYTFSGASSDGDQPFGGMVQGADGGLYGTTSNSIFKLTFSPALSGPVMLTVPGSVTHGSSFMLSYAVANASSATMQRCFATNTGGDASGWVGTKTATTTASTAMLTAPSVAGTYTYALTCGGVESGFATLNVN